MRRKMLIMVIVLALLLALGVTEQTAVLRASSSMLERTGALLEMIGKGQLDGALNSAQQMDKEWDALAKGLEMLVDHGSTDDVCYAFSRLIAALQMEDGATAMVYASELEGALEHVQERHELTIGNIL